MLEIRKYHSNVYRDPAEHAGVGLTGPFGPTPEATEARLEA